MGLVDRIFGWAIVALGAVHNLYALFAYKEFSYAAVNHFSGGLALMFLGAFNLLRVQYGSVAPGLRKVCVAANLVTMASFLTPVIVAGWRSTPIFLAIAMFAGATALSLARPQPGPHEKNRGEAGGVG